MSRKQNSQTILPRLSSSRVTQNFTTGPAAGMDPYYLGVDGGGTSTEAVILDSSSRIVGHASGRASNPLRVGLNEAITQLEWAIDRACREAGIERAEITAGVIALAGIGHPIHYHTMKDALGHRIGLQHFDLVTDARAALEGALDGQPGLIVIAGTGSIAMGRNDAGEEARAGGWGPALGDEGSGYDIARRALQAVASSFDGRSPATRLTDILCRKLGIETASDLPGVIYTSDSDRVEIASLAELVTAAALDGDLVAGEILMQAGRDLGALAVSVIRRLKMEHLDGPVACVGSVFKAGEWVWAPFRQTVLEASPTARIGPPRYSPTVGAAKLARSLVS